MTGGSSPVSSAAATSITTASSSNTKQSSAASTATNASPSNSVDHQDTGSGLLSAGRHSEDLFALSAPLSFAQQGPGLSDGSAFLSTGGNPFAATPAAPTAMTLMVGGSGLAGTGGGAPGGAWGSPVFTGLQVLD